MRLTEAEIRALLDMKCPACSLRSGRHHSTCPRYGTERSSGRAKLQAELAELERLRLVSPQTGNRAEPRYPLRAVPGNSPRRKMAE